MSDQLVVGLEELDQDLRDSIESALGNEVDPVVCDKVYVFGDDDDNAQETSQEMFDFLAGWNEDRARKTADSTTQVSKSIDGSAQSPGEVGVSSDAVGVGIGSKSYVEPPYNPVSLRYLLELDPTHSRCVKAKVRDSVGRSIKIKAAVPVIPEGDTDGVTTKTSEDFFGLDPVPQSDVDKEKLRLQQFLSGVNFLYGFRGVLEKAAMDLEAIGWCAMEVIRNLSGVVVDLAHVPAERIRVLEDFSGFVEVTQNTGLLKPVYYQVFGQKWLSKTRQHPLTGSYLPYDPALDGEISNGQGNYIDRTTGEPTDGPQNAANEIIYKVMHHPKTIYYGVPDITPAVAQLVSNVEISNYTSQFFQNNAVPRYAILVKGISLDNTVLDTLKNYFSQQVKGAAHRTILIPIPSMRGDVSITFQKLDVEYHDGSLLETKRDNKQDIMTAHGVPPAILGVADAASIGSGKGMSQAEIYKDRVVSPLQESWEDCLNKLFRYGLGITLVKLKLDPLDIRDRKEEMETLTGFLKMGVLTINSLISMAGLGDPVKGGDRPFILTPGGIQFVDDMETAASNPDSAMGNQGTRLGGLTDNNQDQ